MSAERDGGLSSPRRFRGVGLLLGRASLVVALLLVALSTAWAKPFDTISADWEGAAEFVRLARDDLGDGHVRVVEQLDLASLRPIDSVVLIHPEKSLDVGSFSRFMKDGGRVLLLDDYGSGDALLEHFSLHRMPAPEDPASMLMDNPRLAIAEPDGAHPVVAGVQKVVTNHPTAIRQNDLSSLLVIHTKSGETVNVAVAGMVGKGRFLAVSDPSIVMNRMLRYPGNRAFAHGLVAYAADQDTWGKRDGYVYIAADDFTQKGAYGEDSAAGAAWSERLRAMTDFMQTLRREGFPASAIYAFCILLGLFLVIWIAQNAARVHKPIAPRFTRPIPLAAQGGIAGHVAVLVAPTTSRALAMLELKGALEERLSALLDLDRIPPSDAMMQDLSRGPLVTSSEVQELRTIFARLRHVETMILSRRAGALGPVPESEVIATAGAIRRILEAAESRKARLGSNGSPSWAPGEGSPPNPLVP